MSSWTPRELKQALIAAGIEVYRIHGSRVLVADRVRENLIMDSGVAVVAGDGCAVRFVVRTQASQFPGESEPQLFDRARRLAKTTAKRGYSEVETAVVPVPNPGDRTTTLDTWYEVVFEKPVEGEKEILEEIHFALRLEKSAAPG